MWEIIGGAGIAGFFSLLVYIITRGQNQKIAEAEAKADNCIPVALCEERSGNIQKNLTDLSQDFKDFEKRQSDRFEKLFDKIDQIK